MPGKMQLYGPTCNESWLSDALEFAGVNISFQSANDVLSFPLFVRDFFLSFFQSCSQAHAEAVYGNTTCLREFIICVQGSMAVDCMQHIAGP